MLRSRVSSTLKSVSVATNLSCKRLRGLGPTPAFGGSCPASPTRSRSLRSSRLTKQAVRRENTGAVSFRVQGASGRTFRKEAVFIQNGERIEEQQRCDEQVEQGHVCALLT